MTGKLGAEVQVVGTKVSALLTVSLTLKATVNGSEVEVDYVGMFDSESGVLPTIAQLATGAQHVQGKSLIITVGGRDYWLTQTGRVRRQHVDHFLNEAFWRSPDDAEKPARSKEARLPQTQEFTSVAKLEEDERKRVQERAATAAATESPVVPAKTRKQRKTNVGKPDRPARPIVATQAPAPVAAPAASRWTVRTW